MVFRLRDNDDFAKEEQLEEMKIQRTKIRNKLKKLNLQVREQANKEKTLLFLKIDAQHRYRKEAEARGIKVELKQIHGGAMCPYREDLEKDKCFQPAPDDQSETVFSSLQQLEMTDYIIRSQPMDKSEPIKPEELIHNQILAPNGYFYMHEEIFRDRLLDPSIYRWCDWFSPQPLDQVRVYLGEKIALFFTFKGFYISMLWAPSILGILVFIHQLYTWELTGHLDSPFQFQYAVFIPLWASLFPLLWQRLEDRKKYEWDTVNFEDEETELVEFQQHDDTVKHTRKDQYTEEIVPYWFDDGKWLTMYEESPDGLDRNKLWIPRPTGRCARQACTYLFILGLDALAVVFCIAMWKYLALPMMAPGKTLAGSFVFGVSFAAVSECLAIVFKLCIPRFIEWENWQTATDKEDATILRVCTFRVVQLYFASAFIAFIANRIQAFGDIKCPQWQCMPVVQVVFGCGFGVHCLFRLWAEFVWPWLYSWGIDRINNPHGVQHRKLPMEEQRAMEPFPGVINHYGAIVSQFGFVALFSVAFPIVPLLSLLMSLANLRILARHVLETSQRPPYECAADIGNWQTFVNLLATLSIITNTCLVGLTSRSIYFFYPHMSMVGRVWFIALMEHGLFIIKILMDGIVNGEYAKGRDDWEIREEKKQLLLDEKNKAYEHVR